ncbi:MAG: hypothetical protein ACRESK_09415, partial [Gammaproteobacteria bacterium]
MKNHKPASILTSTLQCIAASVIAGAIAACALIAVVLLLSFPAAAYTNDGDAADMQLVDNPAEVQQGTLLFRNESDFNMAPVLKTDVEITVTGMIARATVKQHFRNPDDHW